MNQPSDRMPSVDEMQQQVTLQQVAAYYNFPLPQGDSRREVRIGCPFNCPEAGV